jgi:hypothetical protein
VIIGDVVKDEEEFLAFVVDEVFQDTFVHDIGVLVRVGAHVFEGDFFFFFPAVVAQEE